MIVLFRRPAIDEPLRLKRLARRLRLIESGDHLVGIHARTQTQEHGCARLGIEQIITLVLRIIDTESITDILCRRVNLQAQVATTDRIKEIETDREILPKARFHWSTQQISRLVEYKIIGRHLK